MDKKCEHCASGRTKERSDAEKKLLKNRINRIEGQIRAISRMIEEDAYCPDIIIQISAASSALTSLSRVMLTEHINTCVLSDIREGKEESVAELAELFGKISK